MYTLRYDEFLLFIYQSNTPIWKFFVSLLEPKIYYLDGLYKKAQKLIFLVKLYKTSFALHSNAVSVVEVNALEPFFSSRIINISSA